MGGYQLDSCFYETAGGALKHLTSILSINTFQYWKILQSILHKIVNNIAKIKLFFQLRYHAVATEGIVYRWEKKEKMDWLKDKKLLLRKKILWNQPCTLINNWSKYMVKKQCGMGERIFKGDKKRGVDVIIYWNDWNYTILGRIWRTHPLNLQVAFLCGIQFSFEHFEYFRAKQFSKINSIRRLTCHKGFIVVLIRLCRIFGQPM